MGPNCSDWSLMTVAVVMPPLAFFSEFRLKAEQSSCKTVRSLSAVLEACSNVNNCSCLTQPLTSEPLGLLKLLIHLSIEKCVFLGGSRIVHRSC